MDLFDLNNEPFDFIENENNAIPSDNLDNCSFDDEFNDIVLTKPSNRQELQTSPLRPIDLPSHRKHYGLLTFYQYRIPIVFRLSNNQYIPYIRFSYALNVLDQHQSNRSSPILDMVKNVPILEMTQVEISYYDRIIRCLSSNINVIPENHSEWSNRLLSVSILDCVLGLVDCSTSFFQTHELDRKKCEQILEIMRDEVKSRWTIEEKEILNQIENQSREINHTSDSVCISSTNIAQRRLLFEKRLDLSIVEKSGGFVQIDSFIFPYIKYSNDNKIYININDIQNLYHQYLLVPSSYIRCFHADSPVAHAYDIVSEQARENFFWNSIRGNIYMSKRLPKSKNQDFDLKFLSLDLLLQAKGLCFVQLFEKSSLDYLLVNYKNQFGRQFVVDDCTRQGGLINDEIPCLRIGKNDQNRVWIPTESKSTRTMTNDERLFVNCILLYHGYWNMILVKEQRWYLEEIDSDLLSSKINLFDKEYYERQQRKLFVNSF